MSYAMKRPLGAGQWAAVLLGLFLLLFGVLVHWRHEKPAIRRL